MSKPAVAEVAEPNSLEQRLIAAARAGQPLDLAGGEHIHAEEIDGWGPGRSIRAAVLRDLLQGRHGELDPRGVRLRGARIDGDLDLDDVRTTVPLAVEDCRVSMVRLRRAHLARLELCGVRTAGVDASDAHLEHDLNLSRLRARAAGDGREGVIRLVDVRIGGTLNLNGAELAAGTDGPALAADRLQVDGSVFLRAGFTATGTGPNGAVRLLSARIGGTLECDGARLTGRGGPALFADGLQVDGSVFLRAGFRAVGDGDPGVVRLPRARIGGDLDMNDAELTGANGPALAADGLQVAGAASLRGGFRTTDDGSRGVVRLLGARIGGQLTFDHAELTGTNGPALHADRLQVDGSAFLRGRFTTDAGNRAAVRLYGAQIAGELDCSSGGVEHHGDGVGLDLRHCQVGTMRLHKTFTARLDPRGLRYGGIPDGPEVEDWLRWFSDHDPGLAHAPQPYQQLAAAYRDAGHEPEARRILIAQQDDLRHWSPPVDQTWARILHTTWSSTLRVTIRYGYQSWRALAGLAATLAAAVTLALAAGAQGVAVHTKDTNTPGTHCALVEQVGLGVDLGAPLVNTGSKTRCAITTDHNTAGGILTAIGWLLQLAGWAFATLFVAGFTGIIRKQ